VSFFSNFFKLSGPIAGNANTLAERKTAEPWFHSSKLPPIKGDALSSNERILTALLKTAANGDLPMYQADALKSGKASAIGEYADFLRQMHKRAPERVTGYEKDVMKRLPENTKAKLTTYFNQSAPPSDQSSIDKDFRDAIADKESKGQPNNGYGARNSLGYLGRYQMGEGALIDSGMKNVNGKWKGTYGVNNERDFLNNPHAQERAFADYMAKTEKYLKKQRLPRLHWQNLSREKWRRHSNYQSRSACRRAP